MHQQIEAILPRVTRPTRYLGNEIGAIRKKPDAISVRVALCFPEVYEIGMSWPGQQILYHLLNSKEGVAAERVYAMWPDMEAELRAQDLPSFSMETWSPLSDFDIVGFTLQHELVFTNILTLLDLAKIPLHSNARSREDPLVLAGGPVAYNPEPMADFLDAVVLGDGEDVFLEICDVVEAWKPTSRSRKDLLEELSGLEGVYVPSRYTVRYQEKPAEGYGMAPIEAFEPEGGAPFPVRRRWVEDLNRVPFPEAPVVPLGKTVHSRLGIEVQRGCTRACRFCQAGYIYRPERQRDPEKVKELVAKSLQNTGYDEVSLLSLSIGDYGCLDSLLGDLLGPNPRGTSNLSVSLPSIRVDTLQEGVVDKIKTARKTGFTMAPEAGSPRLRDVINKALSEDQIARAADMVFSRGWSHIKFYYMIGLPTETDDDVMGIVNTARMCQKIGKQYTKRADIHVSTSTFVPKPFTPFQWEGQISEEEIYRKQGLLKSELKKTRLTYRWADKKESFLEAIFSRGDRRLCQVVEKAWRQGARFDSWTEHHRHDVWMEAFESSGVDPTYYAHRRIPMDEVLPWDVIDAGIKKEWLKKDFAHGQKERFIPDCATGRCYDCGVCDWEVIKNRTFVSKETGYFPQNQKPRGKGAHPLPIATENGPRLTDLLPPLPQVDASQERRLRVRFKKVGRAAFIGHLDLMEAMARALARAGVRVVYSKGFHPKPRLSFGPALMTGAQSHDEFFDLKAMPPLPFEDVSEVIAAINDGLPDGLEILEIVPWPNGDPKLAATIAGAVFTVEPRFAGALPNAATRAERLAAFMAAEKVEVNGHKKVYDARGPVLHGELSDAGFSIQVAMDPQRGSAKPTDVVRAILGETDASAADQWMVIKEKTLFVGVPDSASQTGKA
jgi:radical SAM family uncharacterized protein/radical SAM-linked protein